MDNVKKLVDIEVLSTPIEIKYDCPECGETVIVKYSDFISENSEPCDWQFSTITCHKCEAEVEINSVDWI